MNKHDLAEKRSLDNYVKKAKALIDDIVKVVHEKGKNTIKPKRAYCEDCYRSLISLGEQILQNHNEDHPVVRDTLRYVATLERRAKELVKLYYRINVEIADLKHLTKKNPTE